MTAGRAAGPAVTVRNLRVSRGRREVLHGLSFDVQRGSVTGLIGPSGCGKTTLMRALPKIVVTTVPFISLDSYRGKNYRGKIGP
jgi:ABC-type multidrug transport system ATPase subunit